MDNFESIIREDLEHHVVAAVFTNANPSSSVFLTLRREWGIIHVIVDRFIEMVVEERTNVIGDASGSTEQGSAELIRVNIVEQEADVEQA